MAKGGSSTSVEIPQYIEDAAKRNLARADTIGGLGYMPYYGPEVAAFTGMQNDAFANTNAAANAFGMQSSAGNSMPTPTTFADGSQGYSSLPLFDQAVADFRTARPGQAAAYDNLFIDPFTGQPASGTSPVAPIVDDTTAAIQEAAATLANNSNDQSKSVLDKNPGFNFFPPVVPRTEFDPKKGELVIADPVNEFLKNQSKFEKMADYQVAVDAIPIPPDEIIASQNILANDPRNENYNQNFQDVYDYQYQRSQNDDPDFPGMMTGTMITPEMFDSQSDLRFLTDYNNPNADAAFPGLVDVISSNYLPSPADLAGGLAASELSDVERGQVTANNIANSIFTMGGLLGGPSSVPLIQASSTGAERQAQDISALKREFGAQGVLDSGVLNNFNGSAVDEFIDQNGMLTTEQVTANAQQAQKSFSGANKGEIRKDLQNASVNGTLGQYADAYASKITNPQSFQEKSGIDQSILIDMQKIIAAKGAA